MSLVLTSYNIHRCYGRDGRYDPARIRRVLHELNAQVIALQEVELLHDAPSLLDYFCENSPWKAVAGIILTRESGHYGNALLTSLPVRAVQRIDLSVPRREPRGALHVALDYEGQPLDVLATHLGLRPGERRTQIRRLLGILRNTDTARTTALMGDLNEWFLWGRPLRWLHKHFHRAPAPAGFPACCPLFALDRIWVTPREKLTEVKVLNTSLTRSASDHLPLIARVE